MNRLDLDYQHLLQDILENGVEKNTRNGGTISVFGRQIRHKMSEGFPLLTTKKMPFRLIATELMWFLRGDTNIKFLVDNNCHIWDGDAYKSYSDHFIGYEDVPNKELFIEQIKTDDESERDDPRDDRRTGELERAEVEHRGVRRQSVMRRRVRVLRTVLKSLHHGSGQRFRCGKNQRQQGQKRCRQKCFEHVFHV